MFLAINFQRNFLTSLPPAAPVMISSSTGSFPGIAIAVAVDVLSLSRYLRWCVGVFSPSFTDPYFLRRWQRGSHWSRRRQRQQRRRRFQRWRRGARFGGLGFFCISTIICREKHTKKSVGVA